MSRKRRRLVVTVSHLADGSMADHDYRCNSASSQLIRRDDGGFGANLRFKGGDAAWASYARVEVIVARRVS